MWRKTAVGALIAGLGLNVAIARADFVPQAGSPYALDNEPYSVNPGLFNGDALTDLAVIHGTTSSVRVFTQKPGDAGFTEPFPAFPSGSGANFAAVADFNGDGRQDLAISAYSAAQVKVMLGNGDGSFTTEANIPFGDNTGAIGGGDFNGDGRPDLAVAGWNTGTVTLYLRKGDNTGFVAGGSLSTGGTNPRYLSVGDLDGANGPDIAVSNNATDTVGVLLDQPGGTLVAAPGSPYAVGDEPQYTAIGHFDGDDLPDVAVANRASSNVTILRRKPAGGFEQTQTSPVAVGTNPVGLTAADFRGTGLDDLATANASGTVTVLDNQGGAGFSRGQELTITPAGSPYGIAAADLNDGDSDKDLAVTSLSSSPNELSIFLNRRPPTVQTTDATGVTSTGATLNGKVNPKGHDSDAYFEYGTTTGYGTRVPAGGEIPVGSDRTEHPVGRTITGLTPGTAYHFRIVARNGGGTTVGGDATFTTGTDAGPPPATAVDGPPQATLSAPSEVSIGTPTTLSATGSTPSAGLRYAFDLDGSGRFATDMKQTSEFETTFTNAGDVVVGVRVTDAQGRSDVVRRTVHVTQPPIYSVTTSPAAPKPGQRVTFNVRELLPQNTVLGAPARAVKLDREALATMTFGDDRPVSGLIHGLEVRDRAVSATGTFTHTFEDRGRYTTRISVDDGSGFLQGVDLTIFVGAKPGEYQPAISTPTSTVEQGTCATFENANSGALSVDEVGTLQKRDVNPKNEIINVKPPKPTDIVFGGRPNFGDALVTPATFTTGYIKAGSPVGNVNFNVDKFNVGALNLNVGGRRGFRQADVTNTTTGTEACQLYKNLETAAANVAKAQSDPKWQRIETGCTGGLINTTYSYDQKLEADLVTQDTITTRHTWFAANTWNFGDGTRSGPEAYLPSYKAYHAYDRPGTFTITLDSYVPKNLKTQVADWNANCRTKPLNAVNNDPRFERKTARTQLRVIARYDRITSRGLSLTTGTNGGFRETDLPNVYTTSSSIYLNTRRFGSGYDPKTQVFDYTSDAGGADGVLVVVPADQPLRVVADQGEIIGAAKVYWQSGRQQLALGDMPLKIAGQPGLIIPAANGTQYDFGVFNDPPARINAGTGGVPPKGAAWHVNAAHPVLRRDAGGTIELNVHVPPPLGPDGYGGDITISRDVRSSGRAQLRAGLLDNVDITLPKVEIVPDVLSFNGGRLSHHVSATPPWQATGGLTVFGKKVDMSPDSKKPGCPVSGGLGFQENGELYNAGAVLDGLQIPIPNPPAPNPITALANPALEFLPPTDTRPLDLFGCLTLQDYPEAKAFQVVGCAGFLLAGTGKSIPPSEKLKFCPDQYGNEDFALTDRNSRPDPAKAGNRILKGFVLRVSGALFLGPIKLHVANAYLEVQSSPPGVQAAGHVALKIIPETHLVMEGNIFGYFYGTDDWAVGGSGGVTQDVVCFLGKCPSVSGALLLSSQGAGFCVTLWPISFGGTINFSSGSITPYLFDCDEADLKKSLGVTRALPRSDDLLRQPSDALRAIGAGQSAPVELGGGAGAMIVVNGQGGSPLVQVKDPSGKVVLDDTGAAVQGLDFSSKPVPTDATTGLPTTPTGPMPQGLFHNQSQYHDDKIDMRNATVIRLRAPRKGRYTIVAKDGSPAITAITAVDYPGPPSIKGGVVAATGGAAKAKGQRMLTLKGLRVPKGSTLEITEQGKVGGGPVTTVRGTGAQINRHVAFTPAAGPAEKRKLVAVITRGGIPRQRYVIGSYTSPRPKRAGLVKGLRTRLRGSRLTVSWRPAANAARYIVTVALAKGLKVRQTVKGSARSVTITEPLARNGATVTVQPVTAQWDGGAKATKRLAPVKVKRPKRFVL